MKISVVLPVYNGQQYISQAVQSVLNQTYKDFELIIINDGSTDDSLEIIEQFDDPRIVIVDQKNKGLAKTLNIGLKLAKGKYIARMDADDIALPKRFEEQLNYLERYPNVLLLGTAVDIIDKDGESLCIDVPYTGSKFLKNFMRKVGNPFKHPTVMFHKEMALFVGGYNENIGKYFEDYFLWNELSKHGDIQILKDVLLKYRITPGSIMSSIKSEEFSLFMLRIINKGSFTEKDSSAMLKIKEKENRQNNIDDKLAIYTARVYSTKQNKMNKLFIYVEKFTNRAFALNILGILKKMRIYPKL